MENKISIIEDRNGNVLIKLLGKKIALQSDINIRNFKNVLRKQNKDYLDIGGNVREKDLKLTELDRVLYYLYSIGKCDYKKSIKIFTPYLKTPKLDGSGKGTRTNIGRGGCITTEKTGLGQNLNKETPRYRYRAIKGGRQRLKFENHVTEVLTEKDKKKPKKIKL